MPSHYWNQCWNIVNLNLRNKLQWNLKRNSCIFIQENAFENVVCEMASILSRPQCVKILKRPSSLHVRERYILRWEILCTFWRKLTLFWWICSGDCSHSNQLLLFHKVFYLNCKSAHCPISLLVLTACTTTWLLLMCPPSLPWGLFHEHIEAWTKWPLCCRWYFQMHILECNVCDLDSVFIRVCSSRSNPEPMMTKSHKAT